MDILISAILLIGKILLAAIVVIVVAVAVWFGWSAWVRATAKHDPVEYYRGWGGYVHPIGLTHKITKEEADALDAEGRVYLIGYYDRGELIRVTKMLNSALFFDFQYTYYPNGRLQSATTTNAKGVVKVREYDRWGRGRPDNPAGIW